MYNFFLCVINYVYDLNGFNDKNELYQINKLFWQVDGWYH